ncbi:nascent polypeptide-associated complex subunit beta isoform X1 [Brassica rapa]|uniref:nascent polypeptide-associated complex subunit beta isoform X1 n=1 Tax=Brassica campestris TaxID=3711 RepID=UPI00142D98F2|nr:nascent polypeptide-associated complex subunit beta isoform X1 [Brassica rapa]
MSVSFPTRKTLLRRPRLSLFACYLFPLSVETQNPNHQNLKMNREKLMKMANTVRTGGKGTVRRKKKAVHKTNTTDDKKLQSTLKRIGVNSIPAIEEVNIFKDDVVIQFTNPKVQASVGANTWVVSGSPQTKSTHLIHLYFFCFLFIASFVIKYKTCCCFSVELEDILPQILSHLGPDNMENLKKLAEQFKKQSPGGGNVPATIQEDDDEDDDVPELVAGETFEAAAEEKVAAASS